MVAHLKLAAVLLVATITTSSALRVNYWHDPYSSGAGNVVELNDNGQCVNFHDSDIGKISSINTNGGCVELFTCKNCQCDSIRLSNRPENLCVHANLDLVCSFDNVAASMRVC